MQTGNQINPDLFPGFCFYDFLANPNKKIPVKNTMQDITGIQ